MFFEPLISKVLVAQVSSMHDPGAWRLHEPNALNAYVPQIQKGGF